MNCKNCGAPTKFDHQRLYYVCEYCTSIYIPEENRDGIRVTDVEGSFRCPVCQVALIYAYAGTTRVLSCPKCFGILIEQAVFVHTVQHIRSQAKEPPIIPPPFRPEELARKIFCPSCHKKMDTHPYGGPGNIVIDNCPRCRLNWLDHTELHRITRSPDYSQSSHQEDFDYDQLFQSKKRKGKTR